MNETLEAALAYSHRGFSVIPVKPQDKKPFISWKEFESRQATEDEIRRWWQKWGAAMIGIPTGERYGTLVIDCDTTEGYEAVQELLPDSLITPVARTPRGGWHLWFKYPVGSNITIGSGLMPGVDFRGTGGYVISPPSENGNGGAYRWEEGLALGEVDPSPVPEPLLKKISLYIEAPPRECQTEKASLQFFTKGRRDEDIFHVGHTMLRGGAKEETVLQVLKILARNCTPPYPEKEIPAKIESALKRSDRRERNLTEELRRWIELTSAYFSLTEAYDPLQILTSQKNTVHQIMHRFVKEGYVERHPSRNGVYRRIDKTIDFMDFENADPGNTVELHLPLGLHNKTKIFPKGAIIIAGVSGMGKTLMALNTIYDNRGRFPVFYFNSEMGPEALKKKLSYFPIPISEWAKSMKVIDGWDFGNIPDKIQPDALNVIDYLEPEGDKPYNIHGVISAIIRRLNKGTALITVQKKPEAKMGTGGVYSLKAATLALALDWGRLEIVKNRFREEDPFPSLTKMNFEVHKGWKIVPIGGWFK